jgi:hypothetical protein
MAIPAISNCMWPDKRETALLVYLCYVGYYPRIWGMAPGTFVSYCLLVNIGMARIAFRLRFRKFKRSVAVLATNNLVLAFKGELSTFMIKRNTFPIHFPAIGFVAIGTICFETITVG